MNPYTCALVRGCFVFIRFRRKHSCMDDLRVSDWTELNRELFANTWNPDIGRFRSNFVYTPRKL